MFTIESFVREVFAPPPRPPVKLPWVARAFSAQLNEMLDDAWQACYVQGLLIGFAYGLGVTTMLYVVFVLPRVIAQRSCERCDESHGKRPY